ncbi:hypothetical protein EDD85DRAFT_956480 [Armillaria nabsnona]|nr:hypothetical protein EDD85DRAFT_956480 [Armillaria nabsnona]
MSESPILGVNIWVTLGPLAIACLLQQLLLGVILGQSFQYYAHSFVGDSFLNRFFITSLLILNLLIGGIDMSVIYYIVAKHFGDPSYIDFQTSPMWIEPALTAIVGFIAHSFSLLRYWHLTKFRAIVLILIFLATVSVGSGLAVSGSFIVERCFSSFPRCSTSIILWLVSTCITDLTMSGVLIVHLRSKATTKKIGTVINHLILISIETSGFTAGLALVNLLLFLLMQDSYFHPVFYLTGIHNQRLAVFVDAKSSL